MSESGERGLIPLSGRPLRPKPAGHAWAWIVLTVAVVIFITITLWVVSDARSSKDPFVDLSGDWRMRWTQVPGPAQAYVQNADASIMQNEREQAAVWLSKALALEPLERDVWIKMACLSVVYTGQYTLDERGVERLVEGPLEDVVFLADWRRVKRLLSRHPERSSAWLTSCVGVVLPLFDEESASKTLDTEQASP